MKKGDLRMFRLLLRLGMSLLLLLITFPAFADDKTDASRITELERSVAQLEAAIDSLRSSVPQDRLSEIERQIGLLAAELEDLKINEEPVASAIEVSGFGPAAGKVYAKDQGLSIGGYGEWLYENFDSEREDGTSSGKDDKFDALRGVLYFGYKFNDQWLLNSEIEYEHASTGKSGEVSLEFAYLDFLYRKEIGFRAGLLLVPMGFINELHEPTTFLSAKRPESERVIIPTTWRENGLGIFGSVGGFDYRTYIVTSLRADHFSASGLRGGRQSGSKSLAEDFSIVARIDYVATPGLLAGMSVYTGDSTQNLDSEGLKVGTTIVEAHADWKISGFQFRGLYSYATIDDVAELNEALGYVGDDSVGESLEGYYLEAGYDILSRGTSRQSVIPFMRWERMNTQDSVPDGYDANPANDRKIFTLGLAYKPIEQLVIKADYQMNKNAAESGVDQINVAIGYIF